MEEIYGRQTKCKTNHMKLNGVVILLEQYDQCKADQDKAGRGDVENRLKHASAAPIHRGLYTYRSYPS